LTNGRRALDEKGQSQRISRRSQTPAGQRAQSRPRAAASDQAGRGRQMEEKTGEATRAGSVGACDDFLAICKRGLPIFQAKRQTALPNRREGDVEDAD